MCGTSPREGLFEQARRGMRSRTMIIEELLCATRFDDSLHHELVTRESISSTTRPSATLSIAPRECDLNFEERCAENDGFWTQ
mmetsp:Transcript_31897/g.67111  ORF Transcript_31897/g.67111 Transcript_31897/m.67111 type:complete len:83 (+) Transcript_31897:707-955(+)